MKKDKKGFTLIEIIVVVVILAVLMSVAVPSVLKYINEADNVKYLTITRAINEEVSIYVSQKIAGKKGAEFETAVIELREELHMGTGSAGNRISSIISTKALEGEKIYSIDCDFDGKYSPGGWNYDSNLATHTLTKISVWFATDKGVTGNVNPKFVVTLLNEKMYYYDKIDAGVYKEEYPVYQV